MIVDRSTFEQQADTSGQNSDTDKEKSDVSFVQNFSGNNNKQCLRCWKNGDDSYYPSHQLYIRYCPNCNGSILVCSKHSRTYSPHGLSCRTPGFKFFRRPYLRKNRVMLVWSD